jgi:hypothetical protein
LCGNALIGYLLGFFAAPTILKVEGCSNLPVKHGNVEGVVPVIGWQRRSGPLNQYFNDSSLAIRRRGACLHDPVHAHCCVHFCICAAQALVLKWFNIMA